MESFGNYFSLRTAKFPKLLGELSHSNQFLKVFAVSALGAAIVALIAIVILATRPLEIAAFAPTGDTLERAEMPKVEDQIRAAVISYIEKRYRWEPKTVKSRLLNAKAFIHSGSVRAYQEAAINIEKFSTEKLVSQRVYPVDVYVDLEKRVVSIKGDRVTVIQGLMAAGSLNLELSFEGGPHTAANPWGLYIVKEKEKM